MLRARHAITVAGLQIEAWPVEHATRTPAVGYRVSAGGVRIFYVPDVARLADPLRALSAVDLYMDDGATVDRPVLRLRGSVLIGHATIGRQFAWCRGAGVRRAIFTHCGSGIVRSDPQDIEAKIGRRRARVRRRGACRTRWDDDSDRAQSTRMKA